VKEPRRDVYVTSTGDHRIRVTFQGREGHVPFRGQWLDDNGQEVGFYQSAYVNGKPCRGFWGLMFPNPSREWQPCLTP